ncbi:hypothetical protein EB796_007785 [Bugula neritina]|uniref:Uncharacterized protein n=1 Tax=Bugula neritina TaxID=10212 RepID=A0A7J7K6T8_BUGNE|nr:hypothetical protein EB796_007785 [Bugula neritina]
MQTQDNSGAPSEDNSDAPSCDEPRSKEKNREVLKKWRKRRQLIDDFIRSNVSVYYTQTLTQQVFNKLKPGFKNLFSKNDVVTKVAEGEPIGIAGMKGNVEQLTQELTKAIAKYEAEIRDEKATKTEVLPNVLDYQLNFLKQTDFFTTLQQKHKLKDVSGDVQQRAVAFTGVPANIEAAQRETLNLLPHLAKSKTPMAEKSIRQELLAAGKLQAVWTVENRTLSVYSVDKPSAAKALKIINEVVWEAQYPQDREFDEAEKKLLISGKWNDKKAELCKTFEPLEIVSFGDKPGLGLAGLAHNKGHVLEEIPFFFDQNVTRTAVFDKFPEKIYFLSKYKTDVFKELEGKHNVKVTTRADGKFVSIEGTRDDNANFGRSLDKHLKNIFHDFHTIDDRARVQHINDDPSS